MLITEETLDAAMQPHDSAHSTKLRGGSHESVTLGNMPNLWRFEKRGGRVKFHSCSGTVPFCAGIRYEKVDLTAVFQRFIWILADFGDESQMD
jgi:hypothetical protein